MKREFSTELSWFLGVVILAFATAMMSSADFGVSMVVAPAYLLYRKLSLSLAFVTFGFAEYIVQAVLLCALFLIVRKFRVGYLFSFVTALLYGFLLDRFMTFTAMLPLSRLSVRLMLYCIGMPLSSFAVSLLFHTYLPPAVYELFVKEVSARYGREISRFKTAFDCSCLAVGVLFSFLFFGLGKFVGIGFGTLICALLNGRIIGLFSRLLEDHFVFTDRLPLRHFFTERQTGPEPHSPSA